jgi:hypothetical protein
VEKPILDKHPEMQRFVVPANILSFYSGSLSSFLGRMNRHYFVDPLTHQFQFPESFSKQVQVDLPGGAKRWELASKGSFTKLFKAYGLDPLDQNTMSSLSDPGKLKERVSAILAFQLSALRGKKRKKQKYDELAGEVEPLIEPEPDFLVAPYFYFQNTSDPWFNVSKRALALAKELYPQRPVYCTICFEKRLLLDDNACREICEAFSAADGYLLLVSDFDEQRESTDFLGKFKSFVTLLASQGKPVINLYSQYYSMLLTGKLSGVSFGLCINESRDVTRATLAGRTTIRFYQEKLHIKLREPQARQFILGHIASTDCTCDFCNNMRNLMSVNTSETSRINAIDYQFKDARGELLTLVIEHFLRNRFRELAFVSSNSDSVFADSLKGDAADASTKGYNLIVDIGHLERWADSLSAGTGA